MLKMIQAVMLLFLTSLLGACAALQPDRKLIERPDLLVDPEIRAFILVTELLEKRTEMPGGGDLLKVQFSIEAHQETLMEWAITWFDTDGLVVSSVGVGYRPARILPNQTRFFTAIAPHEKVVNYQLHIRENRRQP